MKFASLSDVADGVDRAVRALRQGHRFQGTFNLEPSIGQMSVLTQGQGTKMACVAVLCEDSVALATLKDVLRHNIRLRSALDACPDRRFKLIVRSIP